MDMCKALLKIEDGDLKIEEEEAIFGKPFAADGFVPPPRRGSRICCDSSWL
jgi:hypothetical protein